MKLFYTLVISGLTFFSLFLIASNSTVSLETPPTTIPVETTATATPCSDNSCDFAHEDHTHTQDSFFSQVTNRWEPVEKIVIASY